MGKYPNNLIESFIQAWNEGVEVHGLQERFGVKRPAAWARILRGRGYNLVIRSNNVKGTPENFAR